MTGTTSALLLTAVLALTACQDAAPIPPPPAPAPRTPAAAAADPLAAARALARADPGGDTQTDRLVRDAQAGAQRLSHKADAWVELGRAWVRKARATGDPGFHLNAAACVDLALAAEADHRPARGLRALVHLNEHRFAAARDVALAILADDPDDLGALGALSDARLELGDFAGAAAAAQRMMDLKPTLPAYTRAAWLRWLQGDAAGAKQVLRQAIDAGRDGRDPEPGAWAIVQAALLFWHEGDYAGAEAGCDLALAWLPDYAPALVCKARAALARGEAARAVPLLERAHEASPLVETAWLLGDARAAAGDAAGAAAAWEAVVREGRRSDRLTLALFYATKGRDAAEALRLIEEERAGRGGVYVDDVYAWALFRAGRLAEARAAAERTLALGTRDARLLYHAGAILRATGDLAGGEALVREALTLNPRFDLVGAAEAEALLHGYASVR